MRTLSISAELSDIRLDKYLADEIELISRSKIKTLILSSNILVNGEPVKPSFLLTGGEVIQIDIPDPKPMELISERIPIDVIYEDSDIIVLNKPAGLVVHPGAGNPNGTLVNGLLHHFDQLSSVSNRFRPGIVHRLDKDTSGIMVVAKNDSTHAVLAEQFSSRTIEKTYLALVWGVPEQEGTINLPIMRHPKDRTLFSTGDEGRASETYFRMVEQFEHLSLIELSPKTGRTHQLRVHLASIGHPIFSDDSYGGGEKRAKGFLPDVSLHYLKLISLLTRQALHALSLVFYHPSKGKRETFVAPMAEDMRTVIHGLEPQVV